MLVNKFLEAIVFYPWWPLLACLGALTRTCRDKPSKEQASVGGGLPEIAGTFNRGYRGYMGGYIGLLISQHVAHH